MANSSVLLVMLPRQLLDNVLQGRLDIAAPVKQIIALRDTALEQTTLAKENHDETPTRLTAQTLASR